MAVAAPTSRLVLQTVNRLINQCTSARLLSTSSVSTRILKFSVPVPAKNHVKQSQIRFLHKTATQQNNPSYEHDGKTTITILNDERGAPLMIDSYTQNGFKLNNGIQVIGPMIIFPKTVLGWDVGGTQDITPVSLALFSILEPKPDVLVVGIGDPGGKLPLETIKFLKEQRINMEILATEHACTTFNFLSGEGRCAVAAIVPPTRIVWTGFDLANAKMKKRKLYTDDDGGGPSPPSPKPPKGGGDGTGTSGNDFLKKLL